MDNQDFAKLFPISAEQQDLAQKVINDFHENQLLWFSGFLAGYVSGANKNKQSAPSGTIAEKPEPAQDSEI
ncbi:MAG: hypothetical protein HC905_13890 [Bacteroidales bacterium]|nr:hypothetical protein [Bacteroidales bacterium]